MKSFMKQVTSFILPVIVLLVVPFLIERRIVIELNPQLFLGLVIVLVGLFVMAQTIWTFIRIGRGTLAPWNPTRKLIIGGMYAYVRNPMILGVFTVLLGEALAISSFGILSWALIFFAINTVYFIFSEEPGLEKRFGEEYREYKQNVPRWIPRLKPYRPE